jgi:hypothetical protein
VIEERVHRLDDEIGVVGREVVGALAFEHHLDRIAPGLDLDLEMHPDRGAQGVEAGSEVRDRGRDSNSH